MTDRTEAELDQRCLDSALRFLANRPRSEQEIRRRLAQKRHESDRIDRVVARLTKLGLSDDRAFATYWLENRHIHRPRGERALRSELFQKGIARDLVDEMVGGTGDAAEDAYRAAHRHAQRWSIADERDFRTRLAGFLQRRGFDWDAIEPAMNRLWDERSAG